MSGPQWKDETSYSRSGPRVERTYALRLPDLDIIITRRIGCGDAWFLDCEQASFRLRDLETIGADEAKCRALRLVRDRLAKIADYARHACEWQEQHTPTATNGEE